MGLAVGIELGAKESQICYYDASMKEPESISFLTGAEKFKIPTVLCKEEGRDHFGYGEEAKKMALSGRGILVADLLEQALEAESISIGEETYETVQLLGIFLRKMWNNLVRTIGEKKVESCVITVENPDKEITGILKKAARSLPLEPEQIRILSYEESFYHYGILKNPDPAEEQFMVLFEYKPEGMEILELRLQGKTGRTYKKIRDFKVIYGESGEILEKETLDRCFLQILQEEIQEKRVTFAFLIGGLFMEEWMKDSLQYLCSGRRVFKGSNLYVKGSGAAAMERLRHNKPVFRYLGKDCIEWEYGIFLDEKKEQFYPLTEAGTIWFEAEGKAELVLVNQGTLEIAARNERKEVCRIYEIPLGEYAGKKEFITAVEVQIHFESLKKAVIQIADFGFGEVTESSGKVWTKVVEEWEE